MDLIAFFLPTLLVVAQYIGIELRRGPKRRCEA